RKFTQGQVLAGGPEVIQLRTFNPDQLGSDISSNNYSFAVAPLRVFPAGGLFNNDVSVTIDTLTSNAVINFITDTSTNIETWPLSGIKVLGANNAYLFWGTRDGFSDSPFLTNVF